MNPRLFALIVGSAAFPAPLASAQDSAPADPSPLSGPSVPDETASPRVQRDFEGNMKPLEVRPEIAALDELTLSEAERLGVDGVLAKRTATMERLIRENIDLLLRAQAVREGNDPEARRALLEDFGKAFKELTADGPLSEQIAAAMSEENAEKFNAINKEYWRELIGPEPGDGDRGRGRIARVAVKLLGQEVKQTYERMIGDGKEQLERVIAELQLTPEQEAKIRAIVTEFGQKTKLNPTGMQRVGLFAQVAKELTPEQRKKAFDLARNR